MQLELFRPAPPIIQQHFAKCLQIVTRPAINNQLRIIHQPASALLQVIHQRILLVWIKRLVKSPESQHRFPSSDQIAKNQFLLARFAHPPHRGIAGSARPERQPTRMHQCEDLFEKRRIGRADVRSSQHLHIRIRKRPHRLSQIPRGRHRIIVQEINQLPARRANRRIPLHRRLLAPRHEYLQLLLRIIQLAPRNDSLDLRLIGSGGYQHSHTRQRLFAHGG
jgi:hypothetical protein